MADNKPLVNAEHLTIALLSVAAVIDAMIKVGHMNRTDLGAAIRETKTSLSQPLREGMFGVLLDYWVQIVELGPSKIRPPTFH